MSMKSNRNFEGTYTSNDGKEHPIKVKIFKRFATFGLAILLVTTGYSCTVSKIGEADDKERKNHTEDSSQSFDKELIEKIICENPDILKEIYTENYVVQYGDSLSSIALSCGNTIKRICELNGFNSRTIIYEGQEIKVERIIEKSQDEKDISSLEAYFHDYLFNSQIAKDARLGGTYSTHIYGNPTSINDVDESSFYGKFVNAYMNFHEIVEPSPEQKQEYIQFLNDLSIEASNLLGSNVIPYSEFVVYITNGSIEFTEIRENNHTIYG